MNRSLRKLALPIAGLAGVLLLVFLISRWEANSDFKFEQEVARIQQLTTPTGGRVSGFSGIERNKFSLKCEWSVVAGTDWKWFRARLPSDYVLKNETEQMLEFERKVGFDVLMLRFERQTDSVRVAFSARAS